MFSMIIESKVKNELNKMNFRYDDVSLVRMKEDVYELKLYCCNEIYHVKYYEKGCSEFIKCYKEMEKYGIKAAELVGFSQNLIIYEDYEDMDRYCSVTLENFNDEDFVVRLGKWYKKFHSFDSLFLIDNREVFNKENIRLVMEKYKLGNNKALLYITNNYDNIKLKLDRVQKCVVIGDFNLDEWIISKETKEIIFKDLNKVYVGYKHIDIKKILGFLSDDKKEVFIREVGGYSKEEEAIDLVVSCINTLILSLDENVFPFWAKRSLEMVNSGELLENAKNLVEWY